jgi:hypothetical protein
MSIWIARDKDETLTMFSEKPILENGKYISNENSKCIFSLINANVVAIMLIDDYFPEIKPCECKELVIKGETK